MEKLLNSIPKEKLYGIDKNGQKMLRGFCLRYSTNKGKWICGYGSRVRKDTESEEANDPIEALAFFVELLNKQKQ